mmetsp:Transcript_35966/g.110817  ORF Transcript_35966/g.110817 Transcript_35966/m.110817 type:complete len:277 (+) Transcript_35966:2909-3739(+)
MSSATLASSTAWTLSKWRFSPASSLARFATLRTRDVSRRIASMCRRYLFARICVSCSIGAGSLRRSNASRLATRFTKAWLIDRACRSGTVYASTCAATRTVSSSSVGAVAGKTSGYRRITESARRMLFASCTSIAESTMSRAFVWRLASHASMTSRTNVSGLVCSTSTPCPGNTFSTKKVAFSAGGMPSKLSTWAFISAMWWAATLAKFAAASDRWIVGIWCRRPRSIICSRMRSFARVDDSSGVSCAAPPGSGESVKERQRERPWSSNGGRLSNS